MKPLYGRSAVRPAGGAIGLVAPLAGISRFRPEVPRKYFELRRQDRRPCDRSPAQVINHVIITKPTLTEFDLQFDL
jgi:hypothetical protein